MLGLQPLLWIKSWIPKGSETDSSIIRTITNATFSWLMKLASIMLQPIYYLCVTCINVRKHSSSFFPLNREGPFWICATTDPVVAQIQEGEDLRMSEGSKYS